MAFKDYREHGGANDATASESSPNDHLSNMITAKAASVAAEKARKEAADRAAAEFKAKAAKDAQELEACRAEIISLKSQLQEAQQLAESSKSQSAQDKSKTENLQNQLTATAKQLNDANYSILQHRTTENNLEQKVKDLTSSNDQLNLQLLQRTSERDSYAAERDRNASQRDHYAAEAQRRESELDNGDITIRQIRWGNRDLTQDVNIQWKVKERVRNGWGIPLSNDFFGCDPRPGERKWGAVRFCRSRTVEGWEYEEKPSMP